MQSCSTAYDVKQHLACDGDKPNALLYVCRDTVGPRTAAAQDQQRMATIERAVELQVV